MTNTVINVKNISRSFGKNVVMENASLQVEESNIYGLVGLNGAGKTTLIRILLGLLRAHDGSVDICGFDPWLHQTAYYRIVGTALESDGFFGNLNVKENLRIFASAKGIAWAETERYFEEYWSGADIFKSMRKVKYLSRGQRVQCGLARAFLGWPRVCFFDEPVVGLDFKAYEHFKSLAIEAKSRGAAILLSSHRLGIIDDICDRVGLLGHGRIEEIERRGVAFSEAIISKYKEDEL